MEPQGAEREQVEPRVTHCRSVDQHDPRSGRLVAQHPRTSDSVRLGVEPAFAGPARPGAARSRSRTRSARTDRSRVRRSRCAATRAVGVSDDTKPGPTAIRVRVHRPARRASRPTTRSTSEAGTSGNQGWCTATTHRSALACRREPERHARHGYVSGASLRRAGADRRCRRGTQRSAAEPPRRRANRWSHEARESPDAADGSPDTPAAAPVIPPILSPAASPEAPPEQRYRLPPVAAGVDMVTSRPGSTNHPRTKALKSSGATCCITSASAAHGSRNGGSASRGWRARWRRPPRAGHRPVPRRGTGRRTHARRSSSDRGTTNTGIPP